MYLAVHTVDCLRATGLMLEPGLHSVHDAC